MKKELELRLVKEFPDFFSEYGGDMSVTCMHWGCSHGDGWFPILWTLCSTIQGYYEGLRKYPPKGKVVPPPFVFTQIKEKFGTLTVYHDGGDEVVRAYVDFAGAMSAVTCEECGSTTDVVRSQGWICTRCKACAEKMADRFPADRWKPLITHMLGEAPPEDQDDPGDILVPPPGTPVVVLHNDETGDPLWSVATLADPENWVWSFSTQEKAYAWIAEKELDIAKHECSIADCKCGLKV